MELFQQYGKNQLSFLSIKKEINRLSIIIDLLLIFRKIFERILFNSLFNYIQENNLLCEHQPEFRPNDSYVYKLFLTVHDIYASFDCSSPFDVRGIFLNMSKAFDKVWHKELIYKMKCFSMNGMSLKLLQTFLGNRL